VLWCDEHGCIDKMHQRTIPICDPIFAVRGHETNTICGTAVVVYSAVKRNWQVHDEVERIQRRVDERRQCAVWPAMLRGSVYASGTAQQLVPKQFHSIRHGGSYDKKPIQNELYYTEPQPYGSLEQMH